MMTFRFCVWIWREHHKDTQHSCVPLLLHKEPIVSANLICFCQPHLCQSETSLRSLDLPNFWLVSFVSFCVLLVLQLKPTFSNSLSTTVKRSWIWHLECVPLTLHVLHLLKIKLFRCLAADWTNTTYLRVFSQICIQCPHFSPFVVTMTLLVCVRRPSNDSATKCSEALEPFVWAEEDAMEKAILWIKGSAHCDGFATFWPTSTTRRLLCLAIDCD